MNTSLTDPGLASPPSPYDDPTPCPECGIGDSEYSEHEADCPSGYPTKDRELDELQNAYREFEDEHPNAGLYRCMAGDGSCGHRSISDCVRSGGRPDLQ